MKRLLLTTAAIACAAASLAACESTTTLGGTGSGAGGAGGAGSGGTSTSTGSGNPLGAADKVDLLLVVDNSRSMADKQVFLSAAVHDLIGGLTNPRCIDENRVPTATQPAGGLEDCPAGAVREFNPVIDMHIGVISSSLGGHGADACGVIPSLPGSETANDKGHLLARLDPTSGAEAPTYQGKGFLVWDVDGNASPPGESDVAALTQTLSDIVIGVGQVGCGYESQLESWYRFLVDPEPYESIDVVNSEAVPSGTDTLLLQQRAEFLRPDSLLAIVMLTDENDCSVQESGQFYMANQLNTGSGQFHLPAARAICKTDPNSACCRSCGQEAGEDENGNACPDDPTCGLLTSETDDVNLRCFDQKRRFGIDFLYPIDRYVQALTSATIADRQGNLVANPIFSDLNPNDDITEVRDPGLVLLAGIVGVPWQDVARDPSNIALGNKDATELSQPTAAGPTTWEIILGDPASYTPPQDPHMVESVLARSGVNPITGTALAPPGSPPGTDPINGSEYTNPLASDLQYACIFPLPQARDCSQVGGQIACDCNDGNNDSPLCAANPSDGNARTLQVNAKAYPGIRELDLLRAMGSQGIVSSICPAQVSDPEQPDFGYIPPALGIVARMKLRL